MQGPAPGSMLDCASVTEDGKDNIYVIVERTSTASPTDVYRQIERMEMVDPNYIDQGVWLDNSMTYNGSTTHSSVSSGAAVSGALIRESGGVKRLSLFAASGAADDTLVVFDAAEGSSLSQIDGVVFQVVNPLSFFFDLYRSLNNSTTDRELFNYELIVSDVYSDYSGTLGYLREQVSGMRFAHQLVYRPGIAAVRADDTMYTDVTVDEGGTYEWADTNHKAGIVHAGETYVSEFETLDIDSPQDPITCLPVTISDILLRFTMATRYSIGRRRSSLVSVSVSDMYAREDFNKSLGYFQGVYESETFPGWKRDGRMVVRSEDGFPFQVAAIVPQISAGDIDV